MYYYKVCMRSGKEYTVVSDLQFEDFLFKLFPKGLVGRNFATFKIVNSDKQEVAILADEVSSVEFATESR